MTSKPMLATAEFGNVLCQDDPIEHLRDVYSEAVNALYSAGTDRMRRRQAERMAIQHLGDVIRQLEHWRDEAVQEDLRRTWGTPSLPQSPPPPHDPVEG